MVVVHMNDDTKLSGAADTTEGREAIQKVQARFQKGT